MTKNKLYEIKWLDHFYHEGHVLVDSFSDKVEFTTTGYFITENKNYYFVSQSVMDDASCMNVMAILKKAILSTREIE